MTTAAPTRYDGVAIALHWLGAACIIALLATGFWMTSAIARPDSQALAYRVFQLHKSLGFLALALAVVRLQWRLAHPLPPPPAGMRAWERFAAGAAHAAFYALLLLLPLTGWLLVSAGWATASDAPLAVPTRWFGLFTVPHLPGVADAAPATRRALAFGSGAAHAALAWTMLTLLALHVAAALKHQFIARDGALARMIPGLAPAGAGQPGTGRRRPAETLAGAGFVTAIAVAAAIAAAPAPKPEGPAQAATPGEAPAGRAPAGDAAAQPPAGAPAARPATAWRIDHGASAIVFSGEHAGAAFSGRFLRWSGEVRFDPDNLAGSRADIVIDTASAATGDATRRSALEGEEWLDPKGFPKARFEAATFRALGGDRFEAEGTLTLKNARVPVTLPFTFTEKDGVAHVSGRTVLDRAALNVGMVSDAGGAWVSKAIAVTITVTARRAGG